MTSQTSCVMSSFGVRGLNTAGVSCGDTITVVSGRTNNTGISSSVESEPSSSGCGDEGDEVVDLSIELTAAAAVAAAAAAAAASASSIGFLAPGWVVIVGCMKTSISSSVVSSLAASSLMCCKPACSRIIADLFALGAIQLGVAKTTSSSSLDGVFLLYTSYASLTRVVFLYASLMRCKPL